MTADEYLFAILAREAVDVGPASAIRAAQATLLPAIQSWAGDNLVSVQPSGSFAKGTANKSSTDIDLFISLSPGTPHTLREIYTKLGEHFRALGYVARDQNVSVNIKVGAIDVDLVPAKQQAGGSDDHSLFRKRADTWTKTNVATHISVVRAGLRIGESRILKLWRDQQRLDFPSFYIELTAIAALGKPNPLLIGTGSLSANILTVLRYLRDSLSGTRVVDPANSNNVISDDVSDAEKARIRAAAERALNATNWGQVVV